MKVYPSQDIRPFVMYCVNGKPRSSLLIESTDSMIFMCIYLLFIVCLLSVVRFGHWVCGKSWHAIKDSLTHHPSSQGWAPGVLPIYVQVLSVSYMYLDRGMCGGW